MPSVEGRRKQSVGVLLRGHKKPLKKAQLKQEGLKGRPKVVVRVLREREIRSRVLKGFVGS